MTVRIGDRYPVGNRNAKYARGGAEPCWMNNCSNTQFTVSTDDLWSFMQNWSLKVYEWFFQPTTSKQVDLALWTRHATETTGKLFKVCIDARYFLSIHVGDLNFSVDASGNSRGQRVNELKHRGGVDSLLKRAWSV